MTAIRTLLLALIASLAAAALSGCAEEREPIDRVQPNALEKSFFEGDWYYQRTVVEVPAGNGFTFVGATDFQGLEIISWDIQENMLFARRSIELINGADSLNREGDSYEGEVVGAFRITSHFDITHQYNSSTGERYNVLFENTTDRPWYEREYFRVDWSQNLVTNYDLDFERASVEPVPYYVQEFDDATGQRNADAPVFEDGYFDVTTKLFARADQIEIPGYGMVPLCWLRGEEFSECGAGEYTIRHSFQQLDPDHQYDPLPYKGPETELFGFFTTDRMNYDPLTGIREQGRERYLNRHNLWVNWFDDEGNLIPVADRTLRPIVYHVNRAFPNDLKDIALNVADQWNGIFSEVVESQGYALAEGEEVFILCPNNPIQDGDPAVCGEPGDRPRIGDMRYSFMAYIPDYMQYGLLGLGPSNQDPRTGEILNGAAYVYHHNNLAAYGTLEMVELLNNRRGADDYIDGVDLTEWVNEVTGQSEAAPRTFGLEQADHMVHNLTHGWANAYWEGQRREITQADVDFQLHHGHQHFVEPYLDDMYDRGMLNGEAHAADARLDALVGTQIEEMMLDPEIMMAGGHEPGTPVLDHHVEQASVVRGGLGRLAMDRQRLREEFAAARNMYLPEMADDALLGLARQLRDTNSNDAYRIIRTAIYTAVLAHEVGHSVGLMHNFGGSDDAINYHPEYWQIRDDGDVGPRLEDPITNAEINSNIYNYAYSSVMDYAGRYTVDGEGVGRYDRAAIFFGYGQQMEVFRDTGAAPTNLLRDWFTNDGDLLTFLTSGPQATHYTEFYNWMGEDLYADDNRVMVDIAEFNGDFTEANVDGETMTRVPYIYCSHNRSDLSDSCLTRDAGADPSERMKNILDDLDTWYITRNFPRGRIGVDTYNYVSRYYGRVYNRLKQWHDIYGLYAALLPQFYSPEQLEEFFTNPRTGWGGNTWAVQNAFNYLVQTIFMPDISGYAGPVPDAGGSAYMRGGFFPARVELDVTDGRYYSTSWGDGDRDCGYMWYECLHHVGFYLDKIMAIEALSDSRTNFVARATPIDIRQWEVSYYNTFSDQIAEINRAIMANEYDRVAPYAEDGELYFPNYAGDLTETHELPVEPFATFSVQLYWQVLGMARFPSNFDRSFIDDSRLFIVGTASAPDLSPDRMITVSDPVSGQTFGAMRVMDRVGAGEAMVNRANTMLSYSTLCDSEAVSATEDDDCQDIPDDMARYVTRDSAAQEYRQYMQLFRVMTDLTSVMTYGNPYNP